MMVTCSGLVTSWLGGQPRPRLRRRPGWDLEDMEATEAMGDMEAMVWEDLGMALDIAGKKQFIYFGVNMISNINILITRYGHSSYHTTSYGHGYGHGYGHKYGYGHGYGYGKRSANDDLVAQDRIADPEAEAEADPKAGLGLGLGGLGYGLGGLGGLYGGLGYGGLGYGGLGFGGLGYGGLGYGGLGYGGLGYGGYGGIW